MKAKKIILTLLCSILYNSCTTIEDSEIQKDFLASKNRQIQNASLFLLDAYEGLNYFQEFNRFFVLSELSSDAALIPTRGGDWDDNGTWRDIHTHNWNPNNIEIENTWNALRNGIYKCNQVLYNNGSAQEILQARFLRAFYYFYTIDLFGQSPYTPAGVDPKLDFLVYNRRLATRFAISELEVILPSLSPRVSGDASFINQDAARFLLAKLYLNKAVFSASNPIGPYVFSTSDMNKVIQNVDAISNSLAPNYWDNFSPTNNTSNEIIFSIKNTLGNASFSNSGIRSRWYMSAHYNQTPSGWNGFTTLSDYYNRFDPNDIRIKYSNPSIISDFGNPVGFQIGQQFAPGGITPLNDRLSSPLIFTANVSLIETNSGSLEKAGIRGQKYIPDVQDLNNPSNDYVLFRYSDALLMKVEAINRGGSGTFGTIMSAIASRTGRPAVATTLASIYDERGRELWWEGWRRNDMVRFGNFLGTKQLKPNVSSAKCILFPIPTSALLNPNLVQNPGY